MSAIVTLHGNIPEGESREFPVAFSGKLMWRIPGISLDRKHMFVSIFISLETPSSTPGFRQGVFPSR